MKNIFFLLIHSILIGIWISCSTYFVLPSQNSHLSFQESLIYLKSWIHHLQNQYKVPGVSIIVVNHKKILWFYGSGFRDIENQKPITKKTVFYIGSVSKVINAILLLQLVEKNQISLDDPIHQYINILPKNYSFDNPITIRHLITHHSGLPSELIKYLWGTSPIPLKEIVKEIPNLYLAHKPGEIFSYSNLGVTLSGYLIETITKKPYSQLLQEFFHSLNMKASSNLSAVKKHLAIGYTPALLGYKKHYEYPILMIPAGGIYASAEDMAKIMQMILNHGIWKQKRILKEKSIQEMFRIQNKDVLLDDSLIIGFPFFLNSLGFPNMIQANHGGDTWLYHTMMILLPEIRLGVMVMTNSSTGNQIASKIAIETISIFSQYMYGITRNPNFFHINFDHTGFDIHTIQGWYNTSIGYIEIFNQKGNQLLCRIQGYNCKFLLTKNYTYQLQIQLFHFIPIQLFPESRFIFKVFSFKGKKHVILYMVKGNATLPFGSQLFSSIELNHNPYYIKNQHIWKKRIGTYTPTQMITPFFYIKNITIEKKENYLLLKILYNTSPQPLIYIVEPISQNQIQIPGYGRNLGDILEFKNNFTLYYSGLLFQKTN